MRHVTRLLVLTLALAPLAAGCGGSSSSSGDVAASFVGTWTFDTGQANANCGALGNQTIPLAGLSGAITRTDNTHIQLNANSACIINFSVSGSTATAASGQSCSLPVPGLGVQPIAITMWTMTLSGSMLTATISGTAVGTSPPLCTAMGGGTLTMHPPSDGGADASSSGG
jgi:hypothetical protein